MFEKKQLLPGLGGERAERFARDHGDTVLRVARSYCNSAYDAEDVYQRTFELLLTKCPPDLSDAALVSWACTVAKNEALMIVRGDRSSATDFELIAEGLEAELPTPAEVFEDRELLGQGREVLSRLRPDQVRCLLLRADDYSYPEICAATGFSYAKVNRLLSEGRKAMRVRHEMLVTGTECRRLEDALSRFADGAADAATANEIELHLDHCMACRATLRDYRDAPRRLAELFPVGLLAAGGSGRGLFGWLSDQFHSAYAWVQERLFGHAVAGPQAAGASTGRKVVLAAALGGTLLAGGAAVQHNVIHDPASKPTGTTAVHTTHLVDPLSVARPDRARTHGGHRSRTHAATDSDLIGSGKDGRDAVRTAQPADETTAADQAGYAADPADAAPAGVENDKQPKIQGIAP